MIKNSPSELTQKTRLPPTNEKQRFIAILQQKLKGTLRVCAAKGALKHKKAEKAIYTICGNVLPMHHGKQNHDKNSVKTLEVSSAKIA